VSDATGLSSASGGNILEPVSLVAIGFLEKGDNSPTEVLPLSRGEILGALLIEPADLLVHLVVHSFLPGSADSVLDVIAVIPLVPSKMVEADKEALDPFLGRLLAPESVVVALLHLAPLLGEQTFEEILPADERLRLGTLLHVFILKVINWEEATAPSVEVVNQGPVNVRVGFSVDHVGDQLVHASIPDIVGSFGLATEHVGGVLRGTATRAFIIVLIFPLDQSGANPTVGRRMLSDPTAPAGFKGGNSFCTRFPIDGVFGS